VVWDDLVRGRISISNTELDDLVIARPDGSPTYNFTVVVDDVDMKVSLVIRGDDHINNTPRQINIYRALGAELPDFAHVPMILGADGARLSKRHGAVSVLQYRDEGFLPEGLLNYLGRLGWSHGDQEIFSLEEMVQLFDIEDVNKSASALNPDKMLWTNQQHILRSSPGYLAMHLRPQLEALGVSADDDAKLAAVARAQQERAKTLREMAENSLFFFRDPAGYEEKAAKKNLTPETAPLLEAVRERLAALPEWQAPEIHGVIQTVAEQQGVGMGRVAQPVRVAVSGGSVSPPIDVTLEILGRDVTLQRIDRAVRYAGG
jgi:glutamyl-tRNA synthetase